MNDPRTAARELRELIEAEAERVEQKGTLTAPVVDALVDAGLFRLLVPRAFGGAEADPKTIVDVFEELSFADGAVGWAVAQNTTVSAYAAYLEPEFAEPLAACRAAAGMFAPLGVAQVEDGGFRVSGSYPFGSGSGHAEFMGGCALVMRGDELVMGDADLPEIRAFIVPSERVMLKGNWDVMGLRGTGSFDFEVPEQFVERGRTFSLFETTPTTGGPLYGLGPVVVGTISSVAWALGVAKRALHEIAEIGKGGRTRLGSLALREQPTFQRGFGYHTSALAAARLLTTDAYAAAVQAVSDDAPQELRDDRLRETKAAASYASEVAKAATQFAYESAGSAGMRNPSRLQRCFRDLFVGAAHQVFDERNYTELAKRHLDLETARF